jgi:hypothetical protein
LAIPESYEACENELFVGMFLLNAGSFLVHAHGVITHCRLREFFGVRPSIARGVFKLDRI